MSPFLIERMNCRSSWFDDRRRLHRPDLPVDPQKRRSAGLKVHVGGALLHREPDQLVEVHG